MEDRDGSSRVEDRVGSSGVGRSEIEDSVGSSGERDMEDREVSSGVEDLGRSSGELRRWKTTEDLPGENT